MVVMVLLGVGFELRFIYFCLWFREGRLWEDKREREYMCVGGGVSEEGIFRFLWLW